MIRRSPRALVAMANPRRLHRVVQLLRWDGWVVRPATDGYHLVQSMAEALLTDDPSLRPDLVVVDLTLPGCSGRSVLEGLRALGWATPVIAIADFNTAEAFDIGAVRVFEKPVDPEALREAAEALRPSTLYVGSAGAGKGPVAPVPN